MSDPAVQNFSAVAKRDAERTRLDPLIHRSVAGAVNGLADFLEVERKRVPDHVLRDAERLEANPVSAWARFSSHCGALLGPHPGTTPTRQPQARPRERLNVAMVSQIETSGPRRRESMM